MMAVGGGRVKLVLMLRFSSNGDGDGGGVGVGVGVGVSVGGLELHKHSPPFRFHLRTSLVGRPTPSSIEFIRNKKLVLRFSSSSSYRIPASSAAALSSSSLNSNHSNYSYEEDDEDEREFEFDEFACFRGLVLDISYRPINVVCWKRAICLEFMEKVPHLLQVVKRRRIKSNLSRKNILYRDSYTCQYCSSRDNLTIDHVIPAARGGEWSWQNLVTACAKCNSKKGQKTLEEANMKLSKVPKVPKDYNILAIPLTTAAIKMLKMRQGTPEEWRQYLS
ncbi:hypothetical protein TIFTF001_008172 [Ficus carica]|uniref:HNH nuclease domain-containing protein n=1 Tax=Ficus carica TaxID=3494 RepID=A0AA87ZSU8_FICCA|nr:hypothetical protein TIFTF001_008172 [Ficus carica]